jgi:hypothetical protein
MGGMNWKRPTEIKGTMNHAKTSFSSEICAGATISAVQSLAPLRYVFMVMYTFRHRVALKMLLQPHIKAPISGL